MKPFYEIIGKRNPIISIKYNNQVFNIQVIGDPHLGKVFRNGVPRNRLGERETTVYETFESLLNGKDINTYVIVGDLFDKVQVSNEAYYKSLCILKTALKNNPSKSYFILSGNHDLSKDTSKISSFKLLENYFKASTEFKNVYFISSYTNPLLVSKFKTVLYFSHYNPFNSLDEEVSTLNVNKIFDQVDLKIAFGHWDTVDYNSNKYIDRKIPDIILNEFDLIVTGHEHKPVLKLVQDKPVLISGSMQPYAFSEEILEDNKLYVTLTIEQITNLLKQDVSYFNKSNVRILYNVTQQFIEPFDCYSQSYKLNMIETPTTIIDKDDNKEELELDSSISFQRLFLKTLVQNTNEENKDFAKDIEKIFLSKNYTLD